MRDAQPAKDLMCTPAHRWFKQEDEMVSAIIVAVLTVGWFSVAFLLLSNAMDTGRPLFLALFAIATIAAVSYPIVKLNPNRKGMMEACLKDGHKEYECFAMLRDSFNYRPMPVIIPMVR